MLLDTRRLMLPRWLNARAAGAAGELDSLKNREARTPSGNGFFLEKLYAWQQSPTLIDAIELVTAGIVLGQEAQAVDAAQFIIQSKLQQAPSVKAAAQKILAQASGNAETVPESLHITDAAQQAVSSIRVLRTSIHNDPRNSLAWTDLSREYAVLGQNEKSENAIGIALKLQPKNRFILRSAVRLFTHLGQPDIAHAILRREPATRYDPWLLSAEIAVATLTSKTSRFVRAGRSLIEQSQHAPHQAAELAASIATLELNAGDNRNARKLFNKSLIDPTENVVAQAEWASRQDAGINCSAELIAVMNSHEAHAYGQCFDKDWHGAVESCRKWWLNEPFSSLPAALGSFLAAGAFEDFKLSEEFARAGLKANPKDVALLNNLTVALLLQGRLPEAEQEFIKIDTSNANDESKIAATATRGMLHFRKGEYDAGQKLYAQAVEEAGAKKLQIVGVLAILHWAREELLAGLIQASDLDDLLEQASKHSSVLVQAMTDILKKNYLDPKVADVTVKSHRTSVKYTSPYLDKPLQSLIPLIARN